MSKNRTIEIFEVDGMPCGEDEECINQQNAIARKASSTQLIHIHNDSDGKYYIVRVNDVNFPSDVYCRKLTDDQTDQDISKSLWPCIQESLGDSDNE